MRRAYRPGSFVTTGPGPRAGRQVPQTPAGAEAEPMNRQPGEVNLESAPVPTSGPIVFGTEFGAVSSAAERVAIRAARQAGVPLLIVHGIDPGRLRLPGGHFSERVDQARAARQVDASA